MPNANRIWSTAPTIRCPICDHEFETTGDEKIPFGCDPISSMATCPKCNRMLECVDVTLTWEWQCIEPTEGGELQTGQADEVGNIPVKYEETE